MSTRHPRSNPDARLESLASSIRRYGLLSPLLVRRIGAERYELVAGARRLNAVRLLHQTMVDAIVLPLYDEECVRIALDENRTRERLHYLDEIEALQQISDDQSEERLKLALLPKEVKEVLRNSRLNELHARSLLRICDGETQLRLAQEAANKRWSPRQLDSHIDRLVPRQSVRGIVRDNRIVINALMDTVKELRHIGVQATGRVEERDESIDVIVTIHPARLPAES